VVRRSATQTVDFAEAFDVLAAQFFALQGIHLSIAVSKSQFEALRLYLLADRAADLRVRQSGLKVGHFPALQSEAFQTRAGVPYSQFSIVSNHQIFDIARLQCNQALSSIAMRSKG
jgi:hypothetical protein